MPIGTSRQIVLFISNLFPLYQYTTIDGQMAARSLADGTLIFAVDETVEVDDAFVRVFWQGDPTRACEVAAATMASIAVARYVELHAVATGKCIQAEYSRLADHFTVKTGASLVLEGADQAPEVYQLLGKLLEKVGTAAAVEALKKALGL